MTGKLEVVPAVDLPGLESLLSPMKKGDPASCRPFIDAMAAPLYNYLYWLTGEPEWAAELFQQCMLRLYNNLARARKAPEPRAWVFRLATQLTLEQARRRQARQRSSWDKILRGGLVTQADGRWSRWDEQIQDATPHESTERLVSGLKELTLPERAAFLLCCVVRVNPRELPGALGVSRRKGVRILLGGYAGVARALRQTVDSPVPGVSREKVRRLLLGLLSTSRADKLAAQLESADGGPALRRDEAALLETIQAMPAVAPPENLAGDAEDHLRAGQEAEEERIATWGFRFMQLTVPLFIIAIISMILLPTISRSMEAARQAAGAENLSEIGAALQACSEQSPGNLFPALARDAGGAWVPDLRLLYPRYIKDPALLVRPSLNDPTLPAEMTAALTQSPPDFDRAHQLLARSYVYTGYVLLDESALAAFQSALAATEAPDLEADLETADKLLRRLKKDVEYFFVTTRNDPQAAAATRATIPIMFETLQSSVFGRNPDGANVLYLDGHVEYVRFGERFPVTADVAELLTGGR